MINTRSDKKLSLFFTVLFVFAAIMTIRGSSPSLNGKYLTAYLDPGTGTMIISAIIGIFATAALGIKTFWYKISRLFRKDGKKSQPK